jgi:hypothetical protein
LENRRAEQVLGRWSQWDGKVLGKGGRRVNVIQKCVHMYVNAKMIPTETVPGVGEGDKESRGGVNSRMMYLKHCKSLCKCTLTNYNNKGEKKKEAEEK